MNFPLRSQAALTRDHTTLGPLPRATFHRTLVNSDNVPKLRSKTSFTARAGGAQLFELLLFEQDICQLTYLKICPQVKTWFQNRRMKHKKNIRKQSDEANDGKEDNEEDNDHINEDIDDGDGSIVNPMIETTCAIQGMY